MINRGSAFTDYKETGYGKTFFSSFNINTGKYLFLSYIKDDRGTVLNFTIIKNELFLLFKNKIAKYSMKLEKNCY